VADIDEKWVDREFEGHDFRDEDLSRLHTERVVFTECDFSGVDLSESEHLGSAFRNCKFTRASLMHTTFRAAACLGRCSRAVGCGRSS
jgi:uncharacterized protein YjbI with pentapeptide repeats